MAFTTTAEIDDAVKTMVAESRFTMQERPGVVKSSIRNETLPENTGGTFNTPKYGTVSTTALTEGVDMANAQAITDSNLAIVPAEFGSQVVLTDMMLMTVKDEFFRVAGRLLGEGFDRQQDQTLCDDAANFSLTLGAAGTALHYGHALAAQDSLAYNGPADSTAGRGGEPAPNPLTLIQTPAALHSLKMGLRGPAQAVGAAGQADTVDRSDLGDQFSSGGITFKSDINFSKDTADDALGLFLSKEAWIFVTLGPSPSEERERDASLRAWEVNFVGRWGRGEYDDSWGRGMLFDSALPTS